MKRRFALLLIAGASASAAAAFVAAPAQDSRYQRDIDRLDRELAGRTAGRTETCFGGGTRLRDISRTYYTGRDQGTVIFGRGGTVWRSDLRNCGGLREGNALITSRPGTSLCSGDIIQLADLQIPGGGFQGACTWGSFTPYTRERGSR